MRRRALTAGVVVLVLAGAAGYLFIREDRASALEEERAIASAQASAKARDAESQRKAKAALDAAADAAAADAAGRAARDAQVEALAQGWEVVTSGELYLRFASSEEMSCGVFDCAGVVVRSIPGCPGGVYVAAAIERDGTVIGSTNVRIGALTADQTGVGMLQDTSNSGGTFRISDVTCYS